MSKLCSNDVLEIGNFEIHRFEDIVVRVRQSRSSSITWIHRETDHTVFQIGIFPLRFFLTVQFFKDIVCCLQNFKANSVELVKADPAPAFRNGIDE